MFGRIGVTEDVRVSMWLVKTRRPAFATVPSLAEHLGVGASLLGLNGNIKGCCRGHRHQIARALGIDWIAAVCERPVRDKCAFARNGGDIFGNSLRTRERNVKDYQKQFDVFILRRLAARCTCC
mgnify:CR=1 FL=1